MNTPPFDLVLFDCDSTLSAVEGVDELARRAGCYDQLAPLTRAAMEGRMPLEKVYGRRLDIIRPDRNAISWLGEYYVQQQVDGAGEVIRTLQGLGKTVHIVSGGFRQAVLVLAAVLNVAPDHVHAVSLRFDDQGNYLDFDRDSPLARSKGKARICECLRTDNQRAVMVGDGITDLEVAEADCTVIGFGGVATRDMIKESFSAFVAGPSLLDVLPLILTPTELEAAVVYPDCHGPIAKP
jgi:phosphoserine phosphatase